MYKKNICLKNLIKHLFVYLLMALSSLKVNAQSVDTLKNNMNSTGLTVQLSQKSVIKRYITPTILVSYGFVSLGNKAIRNLDYNIKAELKANHPNFSTSVDDYLQYAPLIAIYGLDIAGVKGKNKVLDQMALMLITTGITTAFVTPIKYQTKRLRPDDSSNNSFPSGHTATAFAAAEMLNQEFKDISVWYGYGGYAVAIATGTLRMYNNKHWLSDVIAGAGFGILSTKLTYLVYPHLKKLIHSKPQSNTLFTPSYQNNALGFHLSSKF